MNDFSLVLFKAIFVFTASLSLAFAQDKAGVTPQATGYEDAKVAEQIFIPAKDKGFFGKELSIKLEAHIYKPAGVGPFPLVILNHGSTGNGYLSASHTYKWAWMGKFFAEQRGFVVVAPMRRGRGQSDGNASRSESENTNCRYELNLEGVENAFQDIDAVVSYAKTLPYVDISRIVMLGVSRGGLIASRYPGMRPDLSVKGTVNFVGGWSNYRCDGVNEKLFEEAGEKSKVPSLWIYGRKDNNYSDDAIETYYRLFQKGNGNVVFKFYSDVPGEGHNVPQHLRFWLSELDTFLKNIGFPKLQ